MTAAILPSVFCKCKNACAKSRCGVVRLLYSALYSCAPHGSFSCRLRIVVIMHPELLFDLTLRHDQLNLGPDEVSLSSYAESVA